MINNKKVTGIILAAGNSTRYGTNQNKNLEMIKGKQVIEYSLLCMEKNKYIDDILLVIRKCDEIAIKKILEKRTYNKEIKMVIGGNTRAESVYHGLCQIKTDFVLIQDGARPNMKQRYINECLKTIEEQKIDGVSIAVKSKDTIKITDENGMVTYTTKRANTWLIQTPQCFVTKELKNAYKKTKMEENITDDCMLIEMQNKKVKLIQGEYSNIKLTTKEDKKILEQYLNIEDE